MIEIIKGQVNKIALTLNEKTTIDNPVYIMALWSKAERKQINVVLQTDLSSNPARWNSFEISEQLQADPQLGQVSLQAGQYTYTVYQALTDDLDLSTVEGIVETGMCRVIGEDSVTYEYKSSTDTSKNITFE